MSGDLISLPGNRLLHVHGREECFDPLRCCIHNPSDHHMRGWPQDWRSDRRIMERICGHGVGHPDPDDWSIVSGTDSGTHGCDGCCAGAS